jgi:hypothetical protein
VGQAWQPREKTNSGISSLRIIGFRPMKNCPMAAFLVDYSALVDLIGRTGKASWAQLTKLAEVHAAGLCNETRSGGRDGVILTAP